MIEIGQLDVSNTEKFAQALDLIGVNLGSRRREQARVGAISGAIQLVQASWDDRIVACAAYGFSQFQADTWWLGFCAVDSDFRGQHISSRLVDYRLDLIRAQGARWVIAASLEPVDRVLTRGFLKVHNMDPHQLIVLDLAKDS